ncbi:MAG TPA: hypothetical protein VKY85_01205 [Candidatus Angelobacter sp.]|nr:hypothetical protein [Candidatus Angelobacter sp.]
MAGSHRNKHIFKLKTILLSALLAASAIARAQSENPDITQPKAHAFFSGWNKWTLIAATTARHLDAAQSCYHYARGWREVGLPGQGCSTIVAWSTGLTAGGVGLSWLSHHLGHHRLELVPHLLNVTLSTAAIISTFEHAVYRPKVIPRVSSRPCNDACITVP